MLNAGKRFEEDFKNSVPDYCFLHRLKDSAQSYNLSSNTQFTWDNPCDYFLYNGKSRILYAIECKSTKNKSMSFETKENENSKKMIKFHQIKSLRDMSRYDGMICGFLLNFRDEDNNNQRTYFLDIRDFDKMIKKINKVSFNEIDLIMNHCATKVNGEKKRVRYHWDIDTFLNEK